LPSSVSLDLGAILEPLGVAIHGSRRAALKLGSAVLIFGAGAVGLLCAAMAKVCGAKTVIIADIQAERLDFAVQNKFADAKIVVPMKRPQSIEDKLSFAKEVAEMAKAASGVGEVDAVFECTGVESCLQAAIYVSANAISVGTQANPYSQRGQADESC
jgi:L-iditol 2-dehydrogenase